MKELLQLIFHGRWRELFVSATENGWLQLFRYGFVGGIAFVVDFSTYCFFEFLGCHYLIAGVIAFLLAFAVNFCISRTLIFQANDAGGMGKEILSVLIISGIGLVLTEILLYAGVQGLNLDYRVAKIVATILVLFWNYFARKLFVYK